MCVCVCVHCKSTPFVPRKSCIVCLAYRGMYHLWSLRETTKAVTSESAVSGETDPLDIFATVNILINLPGWPSNIICCIQLLFFHTLVSTEINKYINIAKYTDREKKSSGFVVFFFCPVSLPYPPCLICNIFRLPPVLEAVIISNTDLTFPSVQGVVTMEGWSYLRNYPGVGQRSLLDDIIVSIDNHKAGDYPSCQGIKSLATVTWPWNAHHCGSHLDVDTTL